VQGGVEAGARLPDVSAHSGMHERLEHHTRQQAWAGSAGAPRQTAGGCRGSGAHFSSSSLGFSARSLILSSTDYTQRHSWLLAAKSNRPVKVDRTFAVLTVPAYPVAW
jgi:hypothetical protein